jgi:hypothetical protein
VRVFGEIETVEAAGLDAARQIGGRHVPIG